MVYRRMGELYTRLKFYDRAYVAYQNYIAIFSTNEKQNYADLKDVVHHILDNIELASFASQKAALRLISSLAVLNVPQDMKSEIAFLSGRIIEKSGSQDLAEEWFDDAIKDAHGDLLTAILSCKATLSSFVSPSFQI